MKRIALIAAALVAIAFPATALAGPHEGGGVSHPVTPLGWTWDED